MLTEEEIDIKIENTILAYSDIFSIMESNRDLIVFDIPEMRSLAERHVFTLKLKHKYGLKFNDKLVDNLDCHRFHEYCYLARYGERFNRMISFEDEERQPIDEMLLSFFFPTGSYLFGALSPEHDYPKEFFQNFWQELKSYGPKYIDTVNSSLYFELSTCRDVFNNFYSILRKYQELNTEDRKLRKIKRLKAELEGLEQGVAK